MEENPYQSPTVEAKPPAPTATPEGSEDAFRRALKVGVIWQVVILTFLTLVDPPTVGIAYAYTMIGYYLGVGLIMWRRRTAPTPADVLFLKWSPLVFLPVAVEGAMLVYEIRGY